MGMIIKYNYNTSNIKDLLKSDYIVSTSRRAEGIVVSMPSLIWRIRSTFAVAAASARSTLERNIFDNFWCSWWCAPINLPRGHVTGNKLVVERHCSPTFVISCKFLRWKIANLAMVRILTKPWWSTKSISFETCSIGEWISQKKSHKKETSQVQSKFHCRSLACLSSAEANVASKLPKNFIRKYFQNI